MIEERNGTAASRAVIAVIVRSELIGYYCLFNSSQSGLRK